MACHDLYCKAHVLMMTIMHHQSGLRRLYNLTTTLQTCFQAWRTKIRRCLSASSMSSNSPIAAIIASSKNCLRLCTRMSSTRQGCCWRFLPEIPARIEDGVGEWDICSDVTVMTHAWPLHGSLRHRPQAS